MKKIFTLALPITLISILSFNVADGSPQPAAALIPEIGKPCPEFILPNVTHYKKTSVTVNDFKGKWLFLEFWFSGCASCVRRLSEASNLQEKFAGKIQFLMVGCVSSGADKDPRQFYEKRRKKEGLNLPVAYDSVLNRQWKIKTMPHIIIIDPTGVVRHITDGRDMNEKKIVNLLNGGHVSFYDKDKVRENFTTPEYKGKALYHSVLTEWNGETYRLGFTIDDYIASYKDSPNDLRFAGLSLNWLYNIAYFGYGYLSFVREPLYAEVYPTPLLEIDDPSIFEYRSVTNFGKGLYNYSLFVPPAQAKKDRVMKIMQDDLKRVFGYNAAVETREMPVWTLVAAKEAFEKIKTKGGTPFNNAYEGNNFTKIELRNKPFDDFSNLLFSCLHSSVTEPFIDATGITAKIDIKLDADLLDIGDVRVALQKIGLDLVKSTKKMKVLVIRER